GATATPSAPPLAGRWWRLCRRRMLSSRRCRLRLRRRDWRQAAREAAALLVELGFLDLAQDRRGIGQGLGRLPRTGQHRIRTELAPLVEAPHLLPVGHAGRRRLEAAEKVREV